MVDFLECNRERERDLQISNLSLPVYSFAVSDLDIQWLGWVLQDNGNNEGDRANQTNPQMIFRQGAGGRQPHTTVCSTFLTMIDNEGKRCRGIVDSIH